MQNQFGIQNHDNFPLDALPENLRNTLLEVERMVQSPIGLIASSMLSTMAIACQGALNVRTPTGEVVPTSLFMVTIAESGERKTGTDRIFTQPIRDFEAQHRLQYEQRLIAYKSKKYLWDIQDKELKKSAKQLEKNGKTLEIIRAEIDNHLLNEPKAPHQMSLLYSDATIEALLQNLSNQWPNGAIHSSEGLSVLGGRTLLSLGPLSELWDGASHITVDRSNARRYELNDARLSISLMVQSQPFKDFLEKKKIELLNQAIFLAF